MGALSREQLLKALATSKVETEELEIPEWGGSVRLRRIRLSDLKGSGGIDGALDSIDGMVRTMRFGIADESGEPLLSKADARALLDADFAVAVRVTKSINEFNGLGEKAVEEAASTFEPAQSDDSSTE